jgi:hypothetical protein
MVANMPYSAQVERARREEERRAAANGRVSRLVSAPKRRPGWILFLHKWLATPSTDRQMHRKAAPGCAAQ